LFEEDVIGNLRTCITMAPQHCVACGDFHMSWALRRFGFVDPKEWDGFREGIARGIADAHAKGRRPAILIAGAADTGILKTVVEAAHLAGGDAMVREIDVTVADICETPLEMCRNYAAQYGISLETVRTDIGSLAADGKFDVIAIHEVLAFFPPDERLDYMRRIVSWLRPDGVLVSWSLKSSGKDRADKERRVAEKVAALEAFFAGEGHDLSAHADEMYQRVRRGSAAKPKTRPFPNIEDVAAFHQSAGLEVLEELVLDRTPRVPDEPLRQCVVIVARPQV
jgi:SAM-dependent methyltransferase